MTRDEAFRKLAARCTAKECCVWEVREKMRNWNIARVDEDSLWPSDLSTRCAMRAPLLTTSSVLPVGVASK